MSLTLATFLLALGLSTRLTRLFVDDSITRPVRDALSRRVNAGHVETKQVFFEETGDHRPVSTWVAEKANPAWRFLHALFDCPWCFSVWASGAVFGAAYLANDRAANGNSGCLTVFTWIAAAATASYLVGVASTLVDKWASE